MRLFQRGGSTRDGLAIGFMPTLVSLGTMSFRLFVTSATFLLTVQLYGVGCWVEGQHQPDDQICPRVIPVLVGCGRRLELGMELKM